MSADIYRVNWGDQGAAADSVATAISGIESRLSDINRETEALTSQWDEGSKSKVEYQARQAEWTKAAGEMVNSLTDFRTALKTAAACSESTETQACSSIAS